MKRIFGSRKPAAPAPTLEEAGARLTGRGDTLDDKIKKLDAQLLVHRDAIRKARPGPAQDAAKRRALAILKQKKLLEGQREQLYAQQFNMEQTAFALDSVKDTVQTVQAMKAGAAELKATMKKSELDIGGIESLQDDMADLMDAHAEIQDAMAQPLGLDGVEYDEDELLGELDALEEELAAEGAGEEAGPSYLQDDLPVAPAAVAVGGGGGGGTRVAEDELPSVPLKT